MEQVELERELGTHHAACHGWALTCCNWDRQQAHDVLQESYLRVLDGRARFRGESVLRTWLFGVIRRVAHELRRRAALRDLLSLRWSNEAPTTTSASVALGDEERLRRALRALPERQRDVLVLVFYQDLSIAEAAQALDIAVGTARAHYERGKVRLRLVLGVKPKVER